MFLPTRSTTGISVLINLDNVTFIEQVFDEHTDKSFSVFHYLDGRTVKASISFKELSSLIPILLISTTSEPKTATLLKEAHNSVEL